MWRLVKVSGASKTVNTDVFLGEFGARTLHSCAWTFMHEPPLSPPNFTQISSSGRVSCHVSCDTLFDICIAVILFV